jgi:hypothetical protein
MVDEKEQIIQNLDENNIAVTELVHQRSNIWIEHVLFTWQWWLGVALSIVPWVLWLFWRKRQSTDRSLYIGLFAITISVILDISGSQIGLWHYRYEVIPFLPTYFPWDICLMPVSICFLIEYKPHINPFIKALIFAIGASYIAEPFFNWINVYSLDNWRYSYSLPIQFLIYLSCHYISTRDKFQPFNSRG